jgi:hypothetical protein
MFVTPEEIMEVTPYTDVTIVQVRQAQFVIEVYIGRSESGVDSAADKELLARAVTAQTVYMRERPGLTFEQISSGQIGRGDTAATFRGAESPFVAPLAVMACKGLSWKRSRSVRTGSMFQRRARLDWRRD